MKRAFELIGLLTVVVGTSCLFAGCSEEKVGTGGGSAATTTSATPGVDPLKGGANANNDMYKNYPAAAPTGPAAK